MAKQFKLTVEKRDLKGNKDLRQLRQDMKIPGVYYSYDGSNILFQISNNEIKNAIQSGANIFTVNVGGKEQNVVFKSVQYHPVTEQIIHIDLYGVDMNKPISIKIPIVYVGTPLGVTEGGVVVTNLNEIEISCLPSDIPENIEVDISNISIGENIQAGDVDLGDKFKLVTMADSTLMSVTHVVVEETTVVDETEGTDEATGDSDAEAAADQGSDDSSEGAES
ncbi:MAG: 50S ribosomal protein L25 [Candidatus Marinimicrobia bacterium]|nr:50S ribosomal protein L25 [Candidatus Neomarinimicrobiota bacterium]|tara:strand:- start:103 stop:768 length:666 start_codon:yes stop_codon:yes gene_type:complete